MGLFQRLQTSIAGKINKFLDSIEDPRETLDYSYEKQLDLLQEVKRGITALVTAKKQLEDQKTIQAQNIITLEEQANEALEQNNEFLARTALEQKVQAQENHAKLTDQIKELNIKQAKLIQSEKQLELKVAQFRTQKEMMKAQYTAAEATKKIGDSLTGMGDDIGNVGDAMRRAEDKTAQMSARGEAIDELIKSGVLDDSLGDGNIGIEKDLAKARTKGKIDKELLRLKTIKQTSNKEATDVQ